MLISIEAHRWRTLIMSRIAPHRLLQAVPTADSIHMP
jgi:hypothetical protein